MDHESCKICWDNEGALISPCACTGTMRFVHLSCLMQWLGANNSCCCDICHTPFPSTWLQTRPIEVQPLPLVLNCALFTMWFYTMMIIMLPFIVRHWEVRPL